MVKRKKNKDIVIEGNEKLSAEKWARKYKLDVDLFKWWTDQKVLITEQEFKNIKNKLYGE
jgi:hypothetical protein